MEINRFNKNCFLFTIDFKSLYTNIPVDDAINSIKKLSFDYHNVLLNVHFIIKLLDLVLNSSLMVFDGEYFQHIFGLIMGKQMWHHFNKYIHGFAGEWIKNEVLLWSQTHLASSFQTIHWWWIRCYPRFTECRNLLDWKIQWATQIHPNR